MKEFGFVIPMLKGKKVVVPKTLVPGIVSGVRDIGLRDPEVRRDREVGAVANEEERI